MYVLVGQYAHDANTFTRTYVPGAAPRGLAATLVARTVVLAGSQSTRTALRTSTGGLRSWLTRSCGCGPAYVEVGSATRQRQARKRKWRASHARRGNDGTCADQLTGE